LAGLNRSIITREQTSKLQMCSNILSAHKTSGQVKMIGQNVVYDM